MGRAPLRTTAIREPVEEIQVKAKKTRLRKRASQRSLMDIDSDIINAIKVKYGTVLQWVTDSVLGQPAPATRQSYEINGWEPVLPDMFDGVFKGMYTRASDPGEINLSGSVLMHRPIELNEEAEEEERQARAGAMEAQRSMVMNGVIPGLGNGMDPMHPTAASKQTFRREVKAPMDVPRD